MAGRRERKVRYLDGSEYWRLRTVGVAKRPQLPIPHTVVVERGLKAGQEMECEAREEGEYRILVYRSRGPFPRSDGKDFWLVTIRAMNVCRRLPIVDELAEKYNLKPHMEAELDDRVVDGQVVLTCRIRKGQRV